MNVIKNYFYFFKLSLISLILSMILLNLFLIFFDTKKALIITLIIIFIFNFIKLKKNYKFKDNYSFLIYSVITRLISRVVEYFLFLIILNLINNHNFSWIITISATHYIQSNYLFV